MNKIISVDEITGGMELAAPVKNKFGQVLLGADVVIEEKHKKLLKMWGVQSIKIKSDGEEEAPIQYDDESVKKAEEILSKRMLWKPKNKFEDELYRIALTSVLEKNF